MFRLSYVSKTKINRFFHPFKYGFWCQMCIVTDSCYTKHPYLGMLWETWDSYAGDGDYGWDYRWTNNRKTWKQLEWYNKFGIEDEGFVFTVPFFIAWLVVLPGTIRCMLEERKAMKYFTSKEYEEKMMEID